MLVKKEQYFYLTSIGEYVIIEIRLPGTITPCLYLKQSKVRCRDCQTKMLIDGGLKDC